MDFNDPLELDHFTVDIDLIVWIKERITVPEYSELLYQEEYDTILSDFLTNKLVNKLIVYIENNRLYIKNNNNNNTIELYKAQVYQYFIKQENEVIFTKDKIASKIQYGILNGGINGFESLERLMNDYYLPSFLNNNTWPSSVRTDLTGQVHRFMASMTETANQVKGHTVLYLPDENLLDLDKIIKDKDLIQRLEAILIHWTRQIKEVVSNQETSQQLDSIGPLQEIEFWRSRCIDLSGIRTQLERSGVRRIVEVLSHVNSTYLIDFNKLSSGIQKGSLEANDNLKLLSTLQEPCEKLAAASPKNIPELLKEVLTRVRLIWTISNYYNKTEPLTGLLFKISNQIIFQCKSNIHIKEILDGDITNNLLHLKDSISCGISWRNLYDQTKFVISHSNGPTWDLEASNIFAQLEAFVQRCRELIEVCDAQILFARKSIKGNTQLSSPAFGGCRGLELERSLIDIEENFSKYISRLRSANYDLLDVNSSKWHDDFSYFVGGVKDLEIMLTNVINSAFETIGTIAGATELLMAFSYLFKRQTMRHIIERHSNNICIMFRNEVDSVQREFFKYRNKTPNMSASTPYYSGSALWIRGLMNRLLYTNKHVENVSHLLKPQLFKECKNDCTNLINSLEESLKKMYADWAGPINACADAESMFESLLDRKLLIKADDKVVVTTNTNSLYNFSSSVFLTETAQNSVVTTTISEGIIELNFDTLLLRLFSELQYFGKFQSVFNIPYVTHPISTRSESLRVVREYINMLVRTYNTLFESLSFKERILFGDFMRKLDRKLGPGIAKFNWTSKDIKDSFIKNCKEACGDIMTLVERYKANNLEINRQCRRISHINMVNILKTIVYEESLFDQSQKEHVIKVKEELIDSFNIVVKSLQNSFEFLKSETPEVQGEWHSYVLVIDKKIENALRIAIKRSLQELSKSINFDSQTESHPLFKVNVVLDEVKSKIEFLPSIQSLQSLVNDVAKQLISSIQVLPRITVALVAADDRLMSACDPVPSFYTVISADEEIVKVLMTVMGGVSSISSLLYDLIKPWESQNYRQIWEYDKDLFMKRYSQTKRNTFNQDVMRYRELQAEISQSDSLLAAKFIRVDFSLLKQSLVSHCILWQLKLTNLLHSNAEQELKLLHNMFSSNSELLKNYPTTLEQLSVLLALHSKSVAELPSIALRFEPLAEMYRLLEKFDVSTSDSEKELFGSIKLEYDDYGIALQEAEELLLRAKNTMKKEMEDTIFSINSAVVATHTELKVNGPFGLIVDEKNEPNIVAAFRIISEYRKRVNENKQRIAGLTAGFEIFSIDAPAFSTMDQTNSDLDALEQVWTVTQDYMKFWNHCKSTSFSELIMKELDKEVAKYSKILLKLSKTVPQFKCLLNLEDRIAQLRSTLPLIRDLSSNAIRPRHWDQLKQDINQYNFDPYEKVFTLESLLALGIHNFVDVIADISAVASRQLNIEISLDDIQKVWEILCMDIVVYKDSYFKLKSTDDLYQFLEDHQVSLSSMRNSPYYLVFSERINYWATSLNEVSETLEMVLTVQRQWIYLESIFIGSDDIRKQLPAETQLFERINQSWIGTINRLFEVKVALRGLREHENLSLMNSTLEKIQKSLDQYLEQKRQDFPRFYFLSNDDLLEILGQSRDPLQVQKHIRKCFAGIKLLELIPPNKNNNRFWEASGMRSADGEVIQFIQNVACEGAVEHWMSKIEAVMFLTLQKLLRDSIAIISKPNSKKEAWIKTTVGQLVVTSGQISWTAECTRQLMELHKNKKSMRILYSRWSQYLERLSIYIRSNLTAVERLKLVSLITIELHARDVIEELARAPNLTGPNGFEWMKQLRFYYDKDDSDYGIASCRQTNTSFRYGYEYQGNHPRLVITSLTDRCYMTLTMALHLNRGGAPQGPAGTGKTETVKDLGKALGRFVVVFNCSDGMDYLSIGQSFAGLCQVGAWGCFDEFNRIDIEVLSVVGQQVSNILQAMSEREPSFNFEGKRIQLLNTVGIFITMNPGYAGRTELPDNLKSLFRPVSMMVPEFVRIAEVLLHSEGFKTSGDLARKLVTLYDLMRQQFSKQDHYDFGLRAVKSVLNRAGQLYRVETAPNEEIILMRALRDLNLSKLVSEDVPLFNGLFQDLFPNTDIPLMEGGALNDEIKVQLEKAGLQEHPSIIKSITQLFESKLTRHGNMLVGRTLGGKSTTWKILQKAMNSLSKTNSQFSGVETYILNPKSISIDELYGSCDLNTREWTDGIFSSIMKKACTDENDKEKWIILDGPVDTLWIESMNSVLDDNKVLTLLNGDRIAMPPQVSLLFEVQDLSVASPATVSRTGMIYVNDTDLGWKPYITSWLASKTPEIRDILKGLIDRHVVPLLAVKASKCNELVHVSNLHAIRGLANLFDCLCTVENGVDPSDSGPIYSHVIEITFLSAIVWSIGAAVDESSRYFIDLSLRETDSIFPPLLTVYDYVVDPVRKDWIIWDDKVPKTWKAPINAPYHKFFIPTKDTCRSGFIISSLMAGKIPTLVVGGIGTGKTSIINNAISSYDENTALITINFSAATSSKTTQDLIESRLEKRQRNNYGPKNGKNRLIIFADDLNMPRKEQFGSQPPLELLRQWCDYSFWYDRHKQQLRQIVDTQLVAAMGPPGGARSDISPRLLTCFSVLNFTFPSDDQVRKIFDSIINDKLLNFGEDIKPIGEIMTISTLQIYKQVIETFLPTPAKSHYLFNMRDISKVFQGLLLADRTYYDSRESILKLWVHESLRVFNDRLVDGADKLKFKQMLNSKLQSNFQSSWTALFGDFRRNPMFCDFLHTNSISQDKDSLVVYQEASNLEVVRKILESKIEEMNLEFGSKKTDLVLFEDAIEHVLRIYRILRQSRGNMLLVGVGGSGRSSLTRVAAALAGINIVQFDIRKNYRVLDWKEDLKKLYLLTAIERKETLFLFSDTQILDEVFLEDINNILSSGEITNLFNSEDLTGIIDDLRPIAAKENIGDSYESLYAFFIDSVRNHLHIVFCMSPVGSSMRERCRLYPSLVNCTSIDWFLDWPESALKLVAERFLKGTDFGVQVPNVNYMESLTEIFCRAHLSVISMNQRLALSLHRYNYVTPSNYLDLVKGFISLLEDKKSKLSDSADKLRNGITKLDGARQQVSEMTISLEQKKKIVAQKKNESEKMLIEIVQQQRLADESKKLVESDAIKIESEEKECSIIAAEAQRDLDAAEPELLAAQEALNDLKKDSITEIRSYQKPPPLVEKVLCTVMLVLNKEPSWSTAKKEMTDPNFIVRLRTFQAEEMTTATLKSVTKKVAEPDFDPETVKGKSVAAAVMCVWVIAMQRYVTVFRNVAPKRAALQMATDSLDVKRSQLASAREKLRLVIENVAALQERYDRSESEKNSLRKEASDLEVKLKRASDLVSGLAGERDRWEGSIGQFEEHLRNLVGDCAVAAAFRSYAGPFPADYRTQLVKMNWISNVHLMHIPYSPDFSFSRFMSDPTDVLMWQIQGLPSDDFSTENGVLVSQTRRWPLMIDPQSQALGWIKNREGRNLQIIDRRMSTAEYMRVLTNALTFGSSVLMQDVGEELDPSLESLLAAGVISRGQKTSIRFGDKDVDINSEFKFYMTTKLQNPHYTPEVTTKAMIVNFAVTSKGLEDQLLGVVVNKEEPALEEDKQRLVNAVATGKRNLVKLEDQILSLLKSSTGSLIDDEALINTLNTSKVTSEDVKQQLKVALETEIKIDKSRENYRTVSVRSSFLFFVLNDLAIVDPMYQFSLDAYVELFKDSIVKSRDVKNQVELADRIAVLNSFHTDCVYKYARRGLFEKHKLLFSFLMCLRKLQSENRINHDEYNFFLRGSQLMDRSQRPANVCADWLDENLWDNICELDRLPAFKNLASSFEQYSKEWKRWYFSDNTPEKHLPGEWNSKLDELQILMILRSLRPDRVIFAAKAFISANLGTQYIDSPEFKLQDIYASSTAYTPVVFILSPGIDPSQQLFQLAKHVGQEVEMISLGQGQTVAATRVLERGISNGCWVFFANCHLSASWLPELEILIHNYCAGKPHENFRLWLSSDPTPKFPISILQKSIKLTTEAPKGIRNNMLRIYNNITPEQFSRCNRSDVYKKLLFSLSFFHSVLSERRKFHNLGWNINYDFNDSDFSICENLISMYLNKENIPNDSRDKSEDDNPIPWDAMKYLIADANYGGRVTDERDRRLIRVYINQFFAESIILTKNPPLSSLPTYYIPEEGSYQSYLDFIKTFPLSSDNPEAFGQHSNAEVSAQMLETNILLDNLISLQPRTIIEGVRTAEEIVDSICDNLLKTLPSRLDLKAFNAKYSFDSSPIKIVLQQEVSRYNALLLKIETSLELLQKGLKGLVIMSEDLENIFHALLNSKVPEFWLAYPSLKPLGSWTQDLIARIAQLNKWSNEGPPKVFWLGGFTFPSGFLTALQQTTSRRNNIPIDILGWEFIIVNQDESAINVHPKEGAYIKGLYLEGARWDTEAGTLVDANSMELNSPIPIIHFKPVEQKRRLAKGIYQCPLYNWPVRGGTFQHTSFVLNVDLKTGAQDSDYWTKRGTALLLSLST